MSVTRTVVLAALIAVAAPVSAQQVAAPAAIDSSYVIPVRAGANAADAYHRSMEALIGRGYAITGAIPDVAISAVAADAASLIIHATVADDGTVYLSAQLAIAGGGVTVGGTGSTAGGGAVAVERGSRAGKSAWSRMEQLAAAMAAR